MKLLASLCAIAFLIGAGVLVERELRGLCEAAADALRPGT